MRVTFENHGSIVDIGDISFGSMDTTGHFGSVQTRPSIGLAFYQRDLVDTTIIKYAAGLQLQPSEARAMASVLLSAATQAKAVE